jgi:hypothetical protein
MPQQIKKFFLLLLLTELLFAYAPAFAQSPSPTYSGVEKSITTYLCDPTAGGSGVLYQCINQLYKFAIVFASVLGVLFIVVAGYYYMSAEGNSESIDKAKSILETTITALVILLAGYLLLYTLNPDIVQFHGNTLQPVSLTATPGAGSGAIGTGCTGCVNLVSVGVPTQNGAAIYSDPTLVAKLQTLKAQQSISGINWYVTASYDPSGGHLNACHSNGTCADIVVSPKTDASWSSLCIAIKASGFTTLLNEASSGASNSCGNYQTYTSTTGANLHIQ